VILLRLLDSDPIARLEALRNSRLPSRENEGAESLPLEHVNSFTKVCLIMSTLRDVETLLSKLSRAEKAQVLQWVVRDLGDAFPGIETNGEVCGGEPCIVRTRVPIWLLVQARRLGASEAQLLVGHDVVTSLESGNAGRAVPDPEVLAFARPG
jgi:uncharacterized protein (DUF433 family)